MDILNSLDYASLLKEFNDPSKPYKYVVIDNFFKKDMCLKLESEFPSLDSGKWYNSDKRFEKATGKTNVFEHGMYGISKVEDLPETCLDVLLKLNSDEFCSIIKKMTGVSGLLPDEYNRIGQWSGIRMMDEGSFQLIHSDARLHPYSKKEKKITLICYLNSDLGTF